MNQKEIEILFKYNQSGNDVNVLSQYIKLHEPKTPEFEDFIAEVLVGERGNNNNLKCTKKLKQKIAILVEFSDAPKSNVDQKDSCFRSIANVIRETPSVVKNAYYEERTDLKEVFEAIRLFMDSPNNVQQEAWPPLYRFVEEIKLVNSLIQ